MKKRLLVASVAVLWAALPAVADAASRGSDVASTKHNLSSSGPGPIKVAGGPGVCMFCHTPHAANPIAPLWNRHDPGSYYETYESSTLVATVGQPTGSSRLCLSCHDGTIALTQTYNPRTAIAGTIHISPQDAGYIGTDLTDDHPISFVYNAGLAAQKPGLNQPSSLPKEIPLDPQHQLQCTTCHDPHNNSHGKFLRMSNRESRMCTSCHSPEGWSASAHATATASLAGARRDHWDNVPYTSVRENGCENCHRPHGAGGRQRLLRHATEEDNCFSCHDGSVASKNLLAEFGKLSVHPVDRTTGVHDPVENPLTGQEHVECVDCHNPHQTSDNPVAHAPFIKPSMKGATGITRTKRQAYKAVYEYEVCYKCHSLRNPAASSVRRVFPENNLAEEFSPSAQSYHPVEVQGKNADVPSLLQPLNATSLIYCTDCHGSDTGTNGPRGPHGSAYTPLLVRNYVTIDGTPESPAAYALCYGCHNRASLLKNDSFPEHKKHIVEEHAPCSVCHDPHGVAQSTHLVNFDRNVVFPSQRAGTGPIFEDRGNRRGSCTLLCHGEDHNGKDYD